MLTHAARAAAGSGQGSSGGRARRALVRVNLLVQGLRDWILGLPPPKSSHDLSKLKSIV